MRNYLFVLTVFFVCILSSPFAIAQEKEQITVEWIYSDERDQVSALPRFVWLENNTALLYDLRRPKEDRTFEKFDPGSGKLTPAIDKSKAIASLNALLSAEDSTEALKWPLSFDHEGQKAVYLLKGDIYLLELAKAEFQRITDTEEKEKSVNFSPDSKLLAFVRENDLYVYDIERKAEKPLTTDGSETTLNGTLSWVYWEEVFGRRDIGYWWSNDSKAIAYLQTDESPVSVMHYVDFKPTVPRVLKQRYPKTGGKNPIVRVGVVEINKAKTTWVDIPDSSYEYVARVKWLPDSKRLSVQTMNRAQTELDLYFADRASGKVEHIMQETDSAWVNINDDLYFLKDGKHFIWQSERDGYAHLYRFTMDGKLVNQITQGEWALRSSGGPFWLRQAVAAVDDKNGWIYFTALEKSSIERHLYRIRFDGTSMQRLTTEDGVHRIAFSPDADYYFDRYSNIRTLPSLSVYRSDGKLVSVLAEPRPELLAQFDMQYPELFTIPAADGFPMPAELLKPKDFDPNKKYPLIIYIYGGPSAPTVFNAWRSSLYFDQILLRNGYLVARFDHRSATAISKKLENRLLNLMSGPRELKDVIDGVKWLKSQPYVDAERVGIWGWSGGGSFTLNAMTNSKEFKAGIAVAPVTDWHYYDTKWGEFAMKRPEDNPEGYEKTSFVKSAKNLHGRLLLVHGTYDDNVHPQNSWAFIEELIQANIQFDVMFYPMRKHGISDRPARIHLFNKMLEFWNKNL
ncbi:MAG: S9 family peptidase, partial [bacterium]